MASLTPRASESSFWANATMPTDYFPDEGQDAEQQLLGEDEDLVLVEGPTPLDKTIDRIGMGSYQWTLLSLCGFGWMADNMWIQAVAIILPRVQQHYSVPNNYVGAVSSAMFAGMMFGAVGWGTCSDLMGRSTAFNATLFFTALFGLLASFANSFTMLGVILFFLGSAVGGSMPTDGTLLLEHMPRSKQYLVTALSVFFSFGAVLSAVVALLVLPQHSCPPSPEVCDVNLQNQGWKYLLLGLGLITFIMFLARIVFFRLHESPRYLVHAGRPQEAIESLQMISRFNGSDLSLELDDVRDHHHKPDIQESIEARSDLARDSPIGRPRASSTTPFNAPGSESDPQYTPSPSNPVGDGRPAFGPVTQYSSTDASPITLDGHSFETPAEEHPPEIQPSPPRSPSSPTSAHSPRNRPRHSRHSSHLSTPHRSVYEKTAWHSLPRRVRSPLTAWWDRVMAVLSPEWFRTTILVWGAWFFMSLAFTMFNVFLPKLLETRNPSDIISAAPVKTLEESLWDVVIFTIGGCPGAILGAYFIESRLGRRLSLAGSTFLTAFFCIIFVRVESSWAVRASTVGISLSATAMWAVLYGWTPEIFGTKVRGTACGIASALSRIGGMIAPMLGGALLVIDRSVPVYVSIITFAIAGFCVLMLREGEGDSRRGIAKPVVMH